MKTYINMVLAFIGFVICSFVLLLHLAGSNVLSYNQFLAVALLAFICLAAFVTLVMNRPGSVRSDSPYALGLVDVTKYNGHRGERHRY